MLLHLKIPKTLISISSRRRNTSQSLPTALAGLWLENLPITSFPILRNEFWRLCSPIQFINSTKITATTILSNCCRGSASTLLRQTMSSEQIFRMTTKPSRWCRRVILSTSGRLHRARKNFSNGWRRNLPRGSSSSRVFTMPRQIMNLINFFSEKLLLLLNRHAKISEAGYSYFCRKCRLLSSCSINIKFDS